MKIKVFGQLTDFFESDNISVTGAVDVMELKELLINKFPALAAKTFVIAVNKEIIHENIPINEASEIALLPPFSGG